MKAVKPSKKPSPKSTGLSRFAIAPGEAPRKVPKDLLDEFDEACRQEDEDTPT
ncbi:hypothetical protein HBN99_03555 [Pseudomonas oryzihabitans]|uniref:hypothetical protein n=1 Tax=Pseudomonas oryzihabitans TaxID=47885 RepID=UPI0014744C73|nr:hypothetical protein [Pseudomonas oryzihabitans]NMZ63397.1 hypothetical protein [Pseudomonas oryzihabitans]